MGLLAEGLTSGGGGGGWGWGLVRSTLGHGSVDPKTFKLKCHNKATFSSVQYCDPVEGGGGGGGGVYIVFFFAPGRWAFSPRGL